MTKIYIESKAVGRRQVRGVQTFYGQEVEVGDEIAIDLVKFEAKLVEYETYLGELVVDAKTPVPKSIKELLNATRNTRKKVSKSSGSGRSKKSTKQQNKV